MRLKTENRLNHVGIIHSENLMYSIVPIVSNAVFCTENFAKRIDLTLNALIIAKLIFQKNKEWKGSKSETVGFCPPKATLVPETKAPSILPCFPLTHSVTFKTHHIYQCL